MQAHEVIDALWTWTPYLAAGFALNVLISVLAMALGTPLGAALARLRASKHAGRRGAGAALTGVFRNVPSFVLLYYVAFLVPVEFSWGETVIAVPQWLKATLALIIPVVGFASDNVLDLIRRLQGGADHAWLMFGAAWTQYFLIIIMASSTASVIGADEIVGRANTVIAALDAPEVMLWVYLYVSAWFLASGVLVWSAATLVHRRARRLTQTSEG